MWEIPETALTLTERTIEEQWPNTRALPAGKAGVHTVDFVLAYIEAGQMEASFPREQKYIYVVPEIQIDLIFFLKPEFIYKNEAQASPLRIHGTRPDIS